MRVTAALFSMALVVGACGGGSSPRSVATVQAAPLAIARIDRGGFVTVVPRGFADRSSTLAAGQQRIYEATGPLVENFHTDLNVVGGPGPWPRTVTAARMDAIVDGSLGAFKASYPRTYGFSEPRALTVAGAPARSVDFFERDPQGVLEYRKIFVLHDQWLYVITFATPPSGFAAHVGALDQVIGGWRWTTVPSSVTVTSNDGTFTTVIPQGFGVKATSTTLRGLHFIYVAVGPEIGGLLTDVLVVRDSTRGQSDPDALARRAIRELMASAQPGYRFSAPRAVTVDGLPARRFDYLIGRGRRLVHQRIVIVGHRGSAYEILYTAPAAAYAAHAAALDQVVMAWHWTS